MSLHRAAIVVLGASVLLASGARAQETPSETIDVPAGNARIQGHVVETGRTEGALAGVEVVLYALGRDGVPGLRRTTTDAEGAFRFTGIAARPDVTYLVGARHREIPFPGDRVIFAEGETERWVEIRVSTPTDDASQVALVQSSLRVEWLGDRIGIGEVHRLRNSGARVFHVPAEARGGGRAAPLHAELPEGAEGFAMPLGVEPEGAERSGRDFRFWGPIYPGEQEITFRYEIPVDAGEVSVTKRFPSAAGRLRIFGREGGPLEAADGLAARDVVQEEGLRFRPFEREAAAAGFATVLRLSVPESTQDADGVSLVESQLVLEVDDVTLRAQEQHQFEVTGSAIVRAPAGRPLLQFTLPAGAENVRLSEGAQSLGLVRTDDGVGLLGPLAPGTHGLGLAYELRSGPDGAALERRFDRRLPLLRAFVADTGVAVETDRLHRRRPVRDADRTYLIFEAFEVAPDEPLRLTVRPLPPRAAARRPALLVALLGGVAVAFFLMAPLGKAAPAGGPERGEATDATGARRERELLYQSIRDLDHDHETGKLLDADWQRLRAELRARAVELLAQERATGSAPEPLDPSDPAPGGCGACQGPVGPGDKFCSHCGAPLQPSAGAA